MEVLIFCKPGFWTFLARNIETEKLYQRTRDQSKSQLCLQRKLQLLNVRSMYTESNFLSIWIKAFPLVTILLILRCPSEHFHHQWGRSLKTVQHLIMIYWRLHSSKALWTIGWNRFEFGSMGVCVLIWLLLYDSAWSCSYCFY